MKQKVEEELDNMVKLKFRRKTK